MERTTDRITISLPKRIREKAAKRARTQVRSVSSYIAELIQKDDEKMRAATN